MPFKPIDYSSVHFMIIPQGSTSFNLPPINFKLSFSGISIIHFVGNSNGTWKRDQLELDIYRMGMGELIQRARPFLPQTNTFSASFVPTQWIISAAINSISHKHVLESNTINFQKESYDYAGFAVDNFRIKKQSIITMQNQLESEILSGIEVDLAILGTEATLHRVSYYLDAYGHFVFSYPIL